MDGTHYAMLGLLVLGFPFGVIVLRDLDPVPFLAVGFALLLVGAFTELSAEEPSTGGDGSDL